MTERLARDVDRVKPPADEASPARRAPSRTPIPSRPTPIQAKLEVGPAGDRYEQEADAVADEVVRAMRTADTVPTIDENQQHGRIRRRSDSGGAPSEPLFVASRIQRMTGVGAAGGLVDPSTDREIRAGEGGGKPLPDGFRAGVEQAFGVDFGNVRVHEGPRANVLNERIQAKAFTTGSDIYVRDGLPDLSSGEGQHLLAHELTHTIQQGAVGSSAQRSVAIQRFLDPTQQQQLLKLQAQLKTVLASPKGKGKGAAARKKRIDELRNAIEELESTDRSTVEPAKPSGGSLVAPSTGESEKQSATPGGVSELVAKAEAEVAAPVEAPAEPTPALLPKATDPTQQDALEKKCEQLAALESADPATLVGPAAKKRTKDIGRLTRQIAAMTAPAPVAQPTAKQAPPAKEPATAKGQAAPKAAPTPKASAPKPGSGKPEAPVPVPQPAPVIAPVVAPPVEVKRPDLATESLRATQAALAAHLLKPAGTTKQAQAAHSTTKLELESKIAELEAEIVRQQPTMSAAIGKAAAQDISNAFDAKGINQLGGAVPAKEMEGLCATIGAPALRTLVDAFTAVGMWSRIKAWSVKVMQDLLTVHTAEELKATETTIGAARFTDIVTTKAVPAAAVKHYGAAFLRSFAGATNTTWQHLMSISFNAQGAISGGHDLDTFYDFAADQNVRINWTQRMGANTKVNYTTFWDNGEEASTGSKTLIPGLAAKKDSMLANVNDALWNSIAQQHFLTNQNEFFVTTRDGTKSFSGFYRKRNIDTFFPQ